MTTMRFAQVAKNNIQVVHMRPRLTVNFVSKDFLKKGKKEAFK